MESDRKKFFEMVKIFFRDTMKFDIKSGFHNYLPKNFFLGAILTPINI